MLFLLPASWDGLQVCGQDREAPDRCCVSIATVVPQQAQGAEQGLPHCDMLASVGCTGKGVQGQHHKAQALRCSCLFGFLYYLFLPPQRCFSLLSGVMQLDHSRQFSFPVNEKLLHFVP